MKNKKVLFLSEKPYDDIIAWSGSLYNMANALKNEGYELEWVPYPCLKSFEDKILTQIINTLVFIFNRRYFKDFSLIRTYILSKRLQKELKGKDFDILLAPISVNYTAFLNIDRPIVYVNDSNVGQLIDYNVLFKGYGWMSKNVMRFLEKIALNKFAASLFTTPWAANYAIENNKINSSKVHVVPFGANMEMPETFISKNLNDEINLLFFAGKWEGKGGPIALNAYKILKSKGYNVNFTIIGCTPKVEDENITIIPFLNKLKEGDFKKLDENLKKSHFLILPTRNECYGVVFCEASGYSFPSLATNTGGVSGVVRDNINGFVIDYDDDGTEYASRIEYFIHNPEEYRKICISSRELYETELNWKSWGNTFTKIVNSF